MHKWLRGGVMSIQVSKVDVVSAPSLSFYSFRQWWQTRGISRSRTEEMRKDSSKSIMSSKPLRVIIFTKPGVRDRETRRESQDLLAFCMHSNVPWYLFNSSQLWNQHKNAHSWTPYGLPVEMARAYTWDWNLRTLTGHGVGEPCLLHNNTHDNDHTGTVRTNSNQ